MIVFDRYTEQARRVLFFARYETSELGGRAIEVEHLLLGVVREARGPLGELLRAAGVTADGLREQVRERLGSGTQVSTVIEIPFTDATRRVLVAAASEADALGHAHVGPGHLLLGIFREAQAAATLIGTEQLNPEAVRQAITTSPRGVES